MRGIIYTRVSSDEQIKGTSLEFQEDFCRKHCQQKGIEVVAVFREEGKSAKDLSLNNRKKFLEALDFCRKNKGGIQAFVVLRVDRFARNTEDHFAVRKILLDYGTTLHSVTEPIGNKPAEKFIETVLAGAAEYDNALRKQRSTDGMATKINQGICPWKPPIGYKSLHFKKMGLKKTEPDPPDEQIFPLIQKALKEYAKGLSTQTELARMLDEWGLKTIRGRKTTPQNVDRILGKHLKFYAGIITNPWTGEEKEGLHEPMITKEEMFQIRLVRSGKAKKMAIRNRYNPNFPLRRTVTCASCSRPLTGSTSKGGHGGSYHYYHCYNVKCPMFGKGIAKNTIEKEFLKYLNKITPKQDFLTGFKETVLDLWQGESKRFELEANRYERQLSQLETKRKKIFEMREEGSYTKEEFLERKEKAENEIAATQISLSETRIEQLDIEATLTYATKFIRDLGRQWFDLSSHMRPGFQKLVFPAGIPYQREKGFGTPQLGYIYELNRRLHGRKSLLVPHLRISWNRLVEELRIWQQLQSSMA